MKKTTASLLAALTLLTGCSTNAVSSHSDISEATTEKRDVILTMACATEPYDTMQKAIDDFNAADNGCRIEIRSYAPDNYNEPDHHGLTDEESTRLDFEIIQDLINSDEVDLVGAFSFFNDSKYEIFKNKGAFVDLYSFMEDDPEVNRDTLNAHVLSLNEKDGKLYGIPEYYFAETLIGKSEYVGTKRNWSLDEFVSHWNNMPEGSTVNGSVNAENIYYDVLRANTSAYVDYENAEVHFDSPDFRNTLEFLSRFPSNHGNKGEYLYNAPRFVARYMILSAESAINSELDSSTYQSTSSRLRDGSYTLVGFPTSDGQGAYLTRGGIECSVRASSSPEKQAAAWEFIRQFYTEDHQVENYRERYENYNMATGKTEITWSEPMGFCINDAARKRTAEKTINGDYLPEGVTLTVGGKEVEHIGEELTLDEADCEYLFDYVESIDRWQTAYIDRALFRIVEDEVLAYLGGDQDLDRTIEIIQNRASLWISEQS